MSSAAARLHRPQAADRIADRLLSMVGGPFSAAAGERAASKNRREVAPKAGAPGTVGRPVSST
jgi:hypothetical protein